MKLMNFLPALAFVSLASAADPYTSYPIYTAPVYPTYVQPELPTTTYDYSSGNSYTTTPLYDDSTEVSGVNYSTGSRWKTTIDADGNMRGTDSNGNLWQYNQSTKTYINTNGKICTGSGISRVCTGG